MEVISSCGCAMGKVDHVEGDAIKLTKNDSPDGQHHVIPTGWVDHIDSHVHLKKNADETKAGWKSDAASCESPGRIFMGTGPCRSAGTSAGELCALKHHVNAFRETDLKAILDRHGVGEVVICGAMSHGCVVVHDACATRDQEFEGVVVPAGQVHAAFMAALKFGYATSVSAEEYLAGKTG
jgi:hypothetical protein